MLTDAQKDDVRRHAGFPVFGLAVGATPPSFGYRYNEWYLILEYRMNNLTLNQENILINTYVATCNSLESAIPTASDNLDTDRAAVWYHNKDEVEDRFALYKLWCNRLIEFMGLKSPSKLLSPICFVV